MKNILMLFLAIGLLSSLSSCRGEEDDAVGDFDKVVTTVANNCTFDLRFYFFDDYDLDDIDTARSKGY